MNAVVLDALNTKMTSVLSAERDKEHDAAVRMAISVALLPKGTAIMLQTDSSRLKTDILAKTPTDADYFPLARVSHQEVTFTDDPSTYIAAAVT
jgi:hypothetical protein